MILEDKYINKIESGESTIIILENNKVIVDEANFGVISLLNHFKDLTGRKDLIIYDKLIGKGAAMLMQVLSIENIYAKTITKKALEMLNVDDNVKYSKVVDNIMNKHRTDLCPIELIAKDIENVEILYKELIDFYVERGYIDDKSWK